MAPFGFAVVVLTLLPARIGYQDMAVLIARQPSIGDSFGPHLVASPFGTIHAATFSLPQPVGTAMPTGGGYHLAAYETGDVTGSISRALLTAPDIDVPLAAPRRDFPEINRSLKGPRLVPQIPPDANAPEPGDGNPDEPASLQPVRRPAPLPTRPMTARATAQLRRLARHRTIPTISKRRSVTPRRRP
jgi:hypothetical protein